MADAVFFGDVARDHYWRLDAWPAAGEKVECEAAGSWVGGMTANAARVYAALGGRAEFVTWVPEGAEGEGLVAGLAEGGVDVAHVRRDSNTRAEVAHVYCLPGEHTVFFSGGDEHPLVVEADAWAAMLGASWLVTSIYRLRRLRDPEGRGPESALARLREAGVGIAVDCDVEPWLPEDERLLAAADIVLMNGVGFERRFGEESRAVDWLRRTAPTATVIRTRGSEGAAAIGADGAFAVGSPRAEVVDVTGAGDALLGSFVHELAQGAPIAEALRFATACASLAVERLGPVLPGLRRELVERRLGARP